MNVLKSDPDLFYSTIIDKRVICFGAGKMPVDAIRALKIRDNVEYFYDNAEKKWNTLVGVQGKRYEVHNPAEIETIEETQDIVFLITNKDYYNEILHQLNTFKNIERVPVFIYAKFELEKCYSYQKTEKYATIQKYWKSMQLDQKERQLEIGLQLLNYTFDCNMVWAKKIADLALQMQKRRIALKIYAKLVNLGFETEEIMDLIQCNFSEYKEDGNRLFDDNLNILRDYPLSFGESISDATVNCWIYYQEESSIFPYNIERCMFGNEITVKEPQNAFCHIEDNGKPILLSNIYSEYVLIYLSYIVRDSERYGSDNHVYLCYDNVDEFGNLLHFVDLSFLKKNPKFIFLLGEESKSLYPLQKEALSEKKEPEILGVDEMQHICILISNGECGSGFFTGVMSSNKYVVGNEDKEFYYYSKVPKQFHDILKNTAKKYSYKEVLSVFENNLDNIVMPMDDKPFAEYVKFFKENYREEDVFNVTDIWKIYFIAKYYLDGGSKQTRFVPCIFWDIHNGKRSAYFNMLKEFTLVDYFAPVRNPVIKLVRCYDRDLFGATCENHYDDLGGRFMSGFNQKYSYPDAFEHKYVVAKFEDCKLYPKEMFQKICYALCIPFDDAMLGAEARESAIYEGEYTRGFDLSPLNRKVDHVFSDFDKFRLEMFYSQMNEHYGYEYYDFDEQPITDEEVEMLFSKPFRIEDRLFDRCYTRVEEDREWNRKFDFENTNLAMEKIWFDDRDELRATLKALLIKGYKISRYEKIKFPFFIRKSIQGSDFEEFV